MTPGKPFPLTNHPLSKEPFPSVPLQLMKENSHRFYIFWFADDSNEFSTPTTKEKSRQKKSLNKNHMRKNNPNHKTTPPPHPLKPNPSTFKKLTEKLTFKPLQNVQTNMTHSLSETTLLKISSDLQEYKRFIMPHTLSS